jgi:hypothetical protein
MEGFLPRKTRKTRNSNSIFAREWREWTPIGQAGFKAGCDLRLFAGSAGKLPQGLVFVSFVCFVVKLDVTAA